MSLINCLFKRVGLTIILFLSCSLVFAQSETYVPKSNTGQVVKHSEHWLSYSESHKQAEWLFYRLTKTRTSGVLHRLQFHPHQLSSSEVLWGNALIR
jgi:hypothetical protein